MTTIRFGLHEIDIGEVVAEFLNDNIDEIMPALRFSQIDRNEKVELGDVSIEVVRVLKDGSVEVDYQYEWSFYAGCKDINDAGIETETIRGKLIGGHIEFEPQLVFEPRTTDEEL